MRCRSDARRAAAAHQRRRPPPGAATRAWAITATPATFRVARGSFLLRAETVDRPTGFLGNPAVTCVIPGTSRVKHLLDNVQAGMGRLPDAAQRKRMVELLQL